jgi:hypothetical protein
MKIRLRLSEPVLEKRHQAFILGTAMRDTAGALIMHSDDFNGHLPKNPFTFTDDGTALEATIAATVKEKDVLDFKQLVMGTINNGFRGNTTKIHEPPSDFPEVRIKAMEVQNDKQTAR